MPWLTGKHRTEADDQVAETQGIVPPQPLSEPPIITVITTIKDTDPRFVRDTARALFAQTFRLFRWVVVNVRLLHLP